MDYPQHQADYEWFLQRWNDFKLRRFPQGMAGVEIEGICLALLDTDMAGLVDAFVRRPDSTSFRGVETLRRLREDLQRVLPSLTGDGKEYFSEWEDLVATVVRLLAAREKC